MLFNEYVLKAFKMITRDDSRWLDYCYQCFKAIQFPLMRKYKLARKRALEHAPHELICEFVRNWDYASFLASLKVSGTMLWMDIIHGGVMIYALNVHGDIKLARQWLLKIVELLESFDIRSDASSLGDYAHIVPAVYW